MPSGERRGPPLNFRVTERDELIGVTAVECVNEAASKRVQPHRREHHTSLTSASATKQNRRPGVG